MAGHTTGNQQHSAPMPEAHGGDNTVQPGKSQGKRGNGAQKRKQKK
jgi:hypothetical protein